MEKLKFSPLGKFAFFISWLCGTVILLGFLLTKSWFFVWVGFYYVLIATIINVIIFFYEFLAFVTNTADKRPYGNSALLVLLNIPIAILYFSVFFTF
jgi:hypothetical protein